MNQNILWTLTRWRARASAAQTNSNGYSATNSGDDSDCRRSAQATGADRGQLAIRQQAKAHVPPFLVSLLRSSVSVDLHLAWKDVGLLSSHSASANHFHPHVSIHVVIQLNLRVRLEFHSSGVAEIDRRAHLVRCFDRRPSQNRAAGAGAVSVYGDRLIVLRGQPRRDYALRRARVHVEDLRKRKNENRRNSCQNLPGSHIHRSQLL